MDKASIRERIRKKKKERTDREQMQESKQILDYFIQSPLYRNADTVYTYVSYNQEVDTRALIRRALEDGKKVAVPKVEGQNITFYEIHTIDDLVVGYQGIPEPCTTQVGNGHKIIHVLPGLCFDIIGNRLGYGGGFYDRYFMNHDTKNQKRVAFAFEFQVCEQLDVEAHDQRVEYIITPKKIIETGYKGEIGWSI